jgi:hypothetical protein
MWVSMANGDHSMATIEVQILVAFVIPYATTLALYNVDIK